MATTDSPACANALAFAARGHGIILLYGIVDGKCACGKPDCDHPGKHPHHLCPHGVNSATTDPEKIRRWFEKRPESNYAIDCATLPTVDIDPRNGGDKTWRELVRKNYDVCGWRVHTGGGGVHIMLGTVAYWLATAGRTGDDEALPSSKLGQGVDFQSVGKYIVGVGSTHASGKRYTWDKSAMPGGDTPPQGVPPWVAKMVRASVPKPKAERTPEEEGAFYDMLMAPALPGHRRERVSQLLGHLLGARRPNRGVLICLVIEYVKATYPDLTDFGEDEIKKLAEDLIARDDIKRGIAA